MRKAQDQQLAEEIDKVSKRVNIVTANLDFKINSDGELKATGEQEMKQDVANNKRDIDKFGVDLAQLLIDYNAFKASAIRNLLDQGSSLEMEIMLNKMQSEDLHYRVSDLQKGFAKSDSLLQESVQRAMKGGAPGGAGSDMDDLRKRQ